MANPNNLERDDPFLVRLRKLRKDHNYSYKDLEKLTGISSSSLQRYEHGLNANLQMKKIWALADAYNVSSSYLMGLDSKDLPYEHYKIILPLLEDKGFKINYHSETERFTLDSQDRSIPITIDQIKALKETTESYFQFKLSEITKPPTE